MHEAREQLGTTLAGAQAEKYINENYNENNYLDNYLKENLPGTKVEGDIAIVDGWAFELDRSVPKIGQDLGREGTFIYPELKIEKGSLAADELSIPIIITAQESESGISKIEVILNGKVVKTFDDCNNSTEEIIRNYVAVENGEYLVKVYSQISRTGYTKVDEISKFTLNRNCLHVGDYVTYIPDSSDVYIMEKCFSDLNPDSGIKQDLNLQWRILKINNDGSVDLFSTFPIAQVVYFKGHTRMSGSDTVIKNLNDLCNKHYSNSSLLAVGRALTLDDLTYINSSTLASDVKNVKDSSWLANENWEGVKTFIDSSWIVEGGNARNVVLYIEYSLTGKIETEEHGAKVWPVVKIDDKTKFSIEGGTMDNPRTLER